MRDLTSDLRKQKFIELILPAILITKQRNENYRKKILAIGSKVYPTRRDQEFIRTLKAKYLAEDTKDLLVRLETHPTSIVLAQAALESGWGTSRFFNEANNIFGVWSFSSKEPRIYGVTRSNGQVIYLKKYDTYLQSIENYFMILATGKGFSEFRKARSTSKDPIHLATYLSRYSEQREEYVKKIVSLIESAELKQYDEHTIDPIYIKDRE
ncbi:Bax protein [Campylobacterota bacterium]|nr:Bax protein [Campylobacterota bacterium]